MSAPFNTCPHCGSNLDHGEKCDCIRNKEAAQAAGEYADQPTITNPYDPALTPGA